ncbi:MAG TPA: VWA domain-containing protein [Pyrinomonadaceae bacterium]|nr:VWA domain-containing protein [Pyrinomonadaceae bacterium]
MFEHPTSPCAKTTARRAPAALLLMLCVALLHVGAQQQPATAPAQQQQRPRRVGDTPTPPAPPAKPATTSGDAPASSSPSVEEVDEGDTVRVETQLVSVPAIVTDATGRPLTGLRAEQFTLYEDGRPQRLANFATTDAPFEVALLLDTSGSTRAEVGLIRRAANAFIEALRPGDRVAILSFNTLRDGTSKLPAVEIKARLTDDRELLREAVGNVSASNGTPFYDALERVAQEVFREPPREGVRGRRALVALTDGVDSASEADYEEARAGLKRAGVVSYFVQVNTEEFVENRLLQDCADDGSIHLSRAQLQRYRRLFAPHMDTSDFGSFCRLGQFERMDISRKLYQLARREMNELARDSGGKTFPVGDLQEARAAFRQVAAEIGTQYSLGYYPTNKARDGSFRTIRVEVKGIRNAQVRAREGYQAPRS